MPKITGEQLAKPGLTQDLQAPTPRPRKGGSAERGQEAQGWLVPTPNPTCSQDGSWDV